MQDEKENRDGLAEQALPFPDRPLQSWKEIAAYLDRDERTAQRWEKAAGLPVRRHREGPRSSVYAYRSELDAWRAAREPKAAEIQSRPPLWHWRVPAAIGILAVVLGALFIRYGPILNPPNPMVEAADGIVVREVWAGPGADHSGGPSPDGKFLSFVDWKTGDLAIREVETGETRRLTNEGSMKPPKAYALYSTISPDGAKVAYSWCQGGKCDLQLIRIDGSGSQTLLSHENQDVFPASWSSDGRFIAALVYGKDMGGIVLVSAADGAVRVLKSGSLPFTYLAFSPTDQFLAFNFPVQGQQKNHDISLIAADGSGELPLIEHPANDRLLGWIPNRDEILFLSNRTGTEDIWVVKVVDGKVQGSPQPLRREVGEIMPRGFTQDGCFFFGNYTRWFTLQTALFNLVTGELQAKLAKPFLGSNFQAEWSPGGEDLAYVAEHHRWGGDLRLHVRNLKTGEERELVSDLDVKTPRWSPDGRHILFRGADRGSGTAGFYQVEVQTGVVTCLVEGLSGKGRARIADWSSDGKAIYYVDSGRLVLKDLASGREKEVYSNAHLTRLLALSPDGLWLVFGTDQSATEPGSLLIMPSSGGAVRELFKKPEQKRRIGHAVWTPDGKYILFTVDDYQLKGTDLWRITPEGGNLQKLWRAGKEINGLSIHPSGQEIAFSLYTQETGIWAMEDYLAAIR